MHKPAGKLTFHHFQVEKLRKRKSFHTYCRSEISVLSQSKAKNRRYPRVVWYNYTTSGIKNSTEKATPVPK